MYDDTNDGPSSPPDNGPHEESDMPQNRPEPDIDAELDRLATLGEWEYAREKKAAAAKLGVSIPELNREIKRRHQTNDMSAESLLAVISAYDQRESEAAKENPKRKGASGWKLAADAAEWESALLRTTAGKIQDCPFNAIQLLQLHPDWQGRLRLNLLSGKIELDSEPITDVSLTQFMAWAGATCQFGIRSAAHVLQAMEHVAAQQGYHPIRDWLDSLTWDGVPRMDTLFSDYLGAHQDEYAATCARLLLVAMVVRAYRPGTLVRCMVILEGPEGIGKSRFVRDLGDPWSAEISSGVEARKDVAEDISGVWLAEIMEMDSLNRAAASRIKAFLTLTNDRFRPAYGRVTIDHPRVTVFVGTINPNDALSQFRDSDQNTRFLPLQVKTYEAEAFSAIRDQLFAEAIQYWRDHPNDWFLIPDEALPVAQELRQARSVDDPWERPIAVWLSQNTAETFAMDDVFGLLEIPQERRSRREATRIGIVLQKLGYEKVRRRSLLNPNIREYVYRRRP